MNTMNKQDIDNVNFKGIVKFAQYLITPEMEVLVNREIVKSRPFITRSTNGMIYAGFDGPFSAKGFYVLDSEVNETEIGLIASYVINVDLKEEQWDKYKEFIVNPIISQFWEDTNNAINNANKRFDEAVKNVEEKAKELSNPS